MRLVLPDRIELSTSPLPRECSTTELRQQEAAAAPRPKARGNCHKGWRRARKVPGTPWRLFLCYGGAVSTARPAKIYFAWSCSSKIGAGERARHLLGLPSPRFFPQNQGHDPSALRGREGAACSGVAGEPRAAQGASAPAPGK
jgi:hypothetical protein